MKLSGKRLLLACMAVSGVVMMAGCTTRLGDFTVLSTKNVDVSGLKPGDRYTGEDCINMILGIPLGDPNWKNAMDQALERGKGDVLVDIVLTVKGWSAIVWGQQCVEIAGTVSQTSAFRR